MEGTLRQRTGKSSNAAGRQPNATEGLSSSSRENLGPAVSSRFGANGDDSGILKQVTRSDSGVYCNYFLKALRQNFPPSEMIWACGCFEMPFTAIYNGLSLADRHVGSDPSQTQAGSISNRSRWRGFSNWRLLACATLVALIFILPSSTNGHTTTTLNELPECDDSGWGVAFERFSDFRTFDVKAHRAALEKLGDTDFLQEFKSSHANVGGSLSGTIYSVRRFGCSIRAYASAESEASRRGLMEEIRYQNRELEALLAQMSRLRDHYETIRWPYFVLNRTTAAAADDGRVGMLKLQYLYHEPLILKWLFRSLGQDLTEAWWETWKAKQATQAVADLGLSTCKAELQLLDRVYEKITNLNSNIKRLSRELPPQKGVWATFWQFCQSFSQEEHERRTREMRRKQDHWRDWYRHHIVENLLLLDSEKVNFGSLPSCSWGLRLTCE